MSCACRVMVVPLRPCALFLTQMQELAQAVAFAQAMLDEEPDTHHRFIDHPDMRVLWYRVKELRQSSQAKWPTFILKAFPSQLSISDSLLEEVGC